MDGHCGQFGDEPDVHVGLNYNRANLLPLGIVLLVLDLLTILP